MRRDDHMMQSLCDGAVAVAEPTSDQQSGLAVM
jgi:hypothetical protein